MKSLDKLSLRKVSAGTVIAVKAVPGSSRDRISGILGDCLKIATSAPPEKGKANAAIARVLAKALSVAPRTVSIVAGLSRLRKDYLIEALSPDQVRDALGAMKK